MSASLDCFPCSDVSTLHWLKGRQGSSLHPSHVARACVISLWVLFLISSTSPFTSSPSSSSLWSPLLFLLPDTFNFHDVVDKYPAHFRWGPWHPGRERASHNWKTRANSSNSHLIKFCRLCSHFETMNQESLLWCLPTRTTYCMAFSLWELKSRTMCCNNSWSVKKNAVSSGFAEKNSSVTKTLAFMSQPRTTPNEYSRSFTMSSTAWRGGLQQKKYTTWDPSHGLSIGSQSKHDLISHTVSQRFKARLK